MKIYFLDPHSTLVGNTLAHRVAGVLKYQMLEFFKMGIREKKIVPLIYTCSSYPLYRIPLFIWLNRIINLFEFFEWQRYNKAISKFVFSFYQLDKNEDNYLVIDSNAKFRNKYKFYRKLVDEYNFKLVFYVSHIHTRTISKLRLFREFPNSIYFSQTVPIIKNPELGNTMNDKNYKFVPYGIQKRFYENEFNLKKDKRILVIGSVLLGFDYQHIFSDTAAKDFDEFKKNYDENNLHPLRAKLFLEKSKYEEYFDNIAEEYVVQPFKSSNYLKTDIVESYNSHKYFICPEDIFGMPSSNFVEGMSTGCVYFGNINYIYFSLYGLKPWVHFVPHDGTIEGIIKSYKKIEDNSDLYNVISKNAREIMKKRYKMEYIIDHFCKEIEKHRILLKDS